MAAIKGVFAREILDSRGIPTIECTIWLDTGGIVATSVPTGTSIGKYEAKELRDGDPNRMLGKGVLNSVNYINTYIGPQLIGKDPTQQEELDGLLVKMDGSENKSKLGANTVLAVSQAILKAGALTTNVPLYYYIQQKFQFTHEMTMPTCIFSMVNGGEHGADNLDIQEFQVIPASHIDFDEALNMGVTVFHKLEEVLVIKGAIHSTGLAGGFAPNLYSNSDVFEILVETIKATQYTFTQDLFFGIDVAAEQIHRSGKYYLKDRSEPFTGKELLEYYKKIRDMYNVFCLEDPFHEDDHEMWKALTAELGESTKIIGDSFLATNKTKVQDAITNKYCNTLLVKPNQVGTITETVAVIKLAQANNWQVIMSHRSGETNDDLIADFAVGVGTEYVRFGPPNRGERIAKYNRLTQINYEITQARLNQSVATESAETATAPAATENQMSIDPIEPVAAQPAAAEPVVAQPAVAESPPTPDQTAQPAPTQPQQASPVPVPQATTVSVQPPTRQATSAPNQTVQPTDAQAISQQAAGQPVAVQPAATQTTQQATQQTTQNQTPATTPSAPAAAVAPTVPNQDAPAESTATATPSSTQQPAQNPAQPPNTPQAPETAS